MSHGWLVGGGGADSNLKILNFCPPPPLSSRFYGVMEVAKAGKKEKVRARAKEGEVAFYEFLALQAKFGQQ